MGRKKLHQVFLAVIVCLLALSGCGKNSGADLASWRDDSPTKQAIIAFVKDVTDKKSENFVPVEKRIATFDMDGTIIAEKQLWLELGVAVKRIETDLQDDKELVALKDELVEEILSGHETQNTSQKIIEVTGRAFQGMPQEDFVAYMSAYMQDDKDDFVDLKLSETFYKPMLELIAYLEKNDFTVYIVSGSERGVVWGAAEQTVGLPRSQMIGSDVALMVDAKVAGTEGDGEPYKPGDKLVRALGFTQRALKDGKIICIYRQVGCQPIFAAGNTDADFSMLNYAMSNPDYPGFAMLVNHDDDVREYSYSIDAEDAWKEYSRQYGWHVVSMKDEFSTVFMKEAQKK